jgi:hypothetical protein
LHSRLLILEGRLQPFGMSYGASSALKLGFNVRNCRRLPWDLLMRLC